MKMILRYFLRGLLILVPIGLTVFVFGYVVTALDKLFGDLFEMDTPGLRLCIGLAVTLGLITLIGFCASNFIGKKIFSLIDKLFANVPFIKVLYSSVKDLVAAFVGQAKTFDTPVIVTLASDSQAKAIGFITRDDLSSFGITDHVAVYFPQSYNFAGNLLIFPKKAVKPLKITSSEAMTFIVSGGVAGKQPPTELEE